MMTRRFNLFPHLPPLTPTTPATPDPGEARSRAVEMILKGGRYRRGLSSDDEDVDKRDDKPGSPPDPQPGDLIRDAIEKVRKQRK
jgi:hypothetical protein